MTPFGGRINFHFINEAGSAERNNLKTGLRQRPAEG
jgi:hypothetical protein